MNDKLLLFNCNVVFDKLLLFLLFIDNVFKFVIVLLIVFDCWCCNESIIIFDIFVFLFSKEISEDLSIEFLLTFKSLLIFLMILFLNILFY
jgi:hypothetical protein